MRFYQSSTPQYVSQFTPLPLDFMAQQIKAREAADATAEDFINKVDELKLKPGNHTDPLVVDKYNEWLDSNKNTIAQKFHAGEIDSNEATRALSKLQSAYQNDPVIRNIKTDAAFSAATNTAIAQGKYKRGISSRGSLLGDTPQFQYIDPRNASEADYAQAHNYITPTSIKSDQNFGPQYKEIEARVTNTLNSLEPTKQIINGITYYKQGNSLVEKKQLTRDMVKSMAMDLANTEINDQITPWTQYKTRLKQQEGQDYTADELAEDITDNYFGYVNSKSIKNQYQWDAAQTEQSSKTPPSPGYYNTSVTPVKNQIQDLNKLDYKKPSPRDVYPIDPKDTPENKKMMREQNKKSIEGGYASFNELNNIQKKMLIKVLTRRNEQGALNQINSGKDLSENIKAKYYPKIKEYLKQVNPNEITLVNNTAIPLSTEEIKTTNDELFGNPSGVKLSDLGTAIGAGMLYMDENGQEYTINQLIDLNGEDAFIKITSKADAKNALNLIGGTQDYTNALHVNIGGKRYFTQGKNYAPGTDEYIIQENNKIINTAFNVKITGLDEEIPIDNNLKIIIEKANNNVNVSVVNNKGKIIKSYPEAVDVNNVPAAIYNLLN